MCNSVISVNKKLLNEINWMFPFKKKLYNCSSCIDMPTLVTQVTWTLWYNVLLHFTMVTSSSICLMRSHETFQGYVSLVFLREKHKSFAHRFPGYCPQHDHTLTFSCIQITRRTALSSRIIYHFMIYRLISTWCEIGRWNSNGVMAQHLISHWNKCFKVIKIMDNKKFMSCQDGVTVSLGLFVLFLLISPQRRRTYLIHLN